MIVVGSTTPTPQGNDMGSLTIYRHGIPTRGNDQFWSLDERSMLMDQINELLAQRANLRSLTTTDKNWIPSLFLKILHPTRLSCHP
jgi:hypothetical protein